MAKKTTFGVYLLEGPASEITEQVYSQIGTLLRTGKTVTLITWSTDPTSKMKLGANTEKFRVVSAPTMRASLMETQSGLMADNGYVFVDGTQNLTGTGSRWDQAGSLLRVLSNRHESTLYLCHHVSEKSPVFPYLEPWSTFIDQK